MAIIETPETPERGPAEIRKRRRRACRHDHGGCKNCKQRHVRCDKATPYCGACKRLGLVCTYQAFIRRFVGFSTKEPQAQDDLSYSSSALGVLTQPQLSERQSFLSESQMTESELFYLRFYIMHVQPHCLASLNNTVWKSDIPRQCAAFPALRNAVVALGALVHAKRTGITTEFAFVKMQETIEQLALVQSPSTFAEAACFMLCAHFEAHCRNWTTWAFVVFLQNVVQVLSLRAAEAASSTMYQTLTCGVRRLALEVMSHPRADNTLARFVRYTDDDKPRAVDELALIFNRASSCRFRLTREQAEEEIQNLQSWVSRLEETAFTVDIRFAGEAKGSDEEATQDSRDNFGLAAKYSNARYPFFSHQFISMLQQLVSRPLYAEYCIEVLYYAALMARYHDCSGDADARQFYVAASIDYANVVVSHFSYNSSTQQFIGVSFPLYLAASVSDEVDLCRQAVALLHRIGSEDGQHNAAEYARQLSLRIDSLAADVLVMM